MDPSTPSDPDKTPKLRIRQTPLRDITNRKQDHLRKVEATASPVLKGTEKVLKLVVHFIRYC